MSCTLLGGAYFADLCFKCCALYDALTFKGIWFSSTVLSKLKSTCSFVGLCQRCPMHEFELRRLELRDVQTNLEELRKVHEGLSGLLQVETTWGNSALAQDLSNIIVGSMTQKVKSFYFWIKLCCLPTWKIANSRPEQDAMNSLPKHTYLSLFLIANYRRSRSLTVKSPFTLKSQRRLQSYPIHQSPQIPNASQDNFSCVLKAYVRHIDPKLLTKIVCLSHWLSYLLPQFQG